MSQKDMVENLEQGDVAETVKIFFEKSHNCPPQKKSVLSIQEVSVRQADRHLGIHMHTHARTHINTHMYVTGVCYKRIRPP